LAIPGCVDTHINFGLSKQSGEQRYIVSGFGWCESRYEYQLRLEAGTETKATRYVRRP